MYAPGRRGWLMQHLHVASGSWPQTPSRIRGQVTLKIAVRNLSVLTHMVAGDCRVIAVKNLSKSYRNVSAVRDLSFDVPPGQILGLVGPNGAGKTTTMRAIAGIIPATSGTIEVAGHDVRKAPLLAKQALAYVPDDPALFSSLTVYEHLVLAARAYSVSDYATRAEQLMAQFEISDRRNTLAQELSRGARQKAAICAASDAGFGAARRATSATFDLDRQRSHIAHIVPAAVTIQVRVRSLPRGFMPVMRRLVPVRHSSILTVIVQQPPQCRAAPGLGCATQVNGLLVHWPAG